MRSVFQSAVGANRGAGSHHRALFVLNRLPEGLSSIYQGFSSLNPDAPTTYGAHA